VRIALGGWDREKNLPPMRIRSRKPWVAFNRRLLNLLRPPLVRGATVLISQKLWEGLGGEVEWERAGGRMVLAKGEDPAGLTVGSREAVVNGERRTLLAAPEVLEEHLYVPVELVPLLLGVEARWSEEEYGLRLEAPQAYGGEAWLYEADGTPKEPAPVAEPGG